MAKKGKKSLGDEHVSPVYATGPPADTYTQAQQEDEAIGLITTALYWCLILVTIILNTYLAVRHGQQYFKDMMFRVKIWIGRVGVKRTISMGMQVNS